MKQIENLKDSLGLIDKYIIISITDRRGIITDVSSAFCEISGYSKDELIGRPHNVVRHTDMPKSAFEKMWQTILKGNVWSGEVKNTRKDGTFYWVKAKIEPNLDKQGDIISFTSIRQDITVEKELEQINHNLEEKVQQEVEKSTAQMKMIQKEQIKNIKMASIGTLAAGITHEINTPLTYIKGNFEMLQYDIEDLPQSDTRTRMLEDSVKISDGIKRISNIVESMREVSQLQQEEKERINILETILTVLRIGFNRTKQITNVFINGKPFSLEQDLEKIELYSLIQKERVEQVWLIIINNALDQLINIKDYEKRYLNIDILEKEGSVTVRFKDNAGGIDESIIDKIFDPFVSEKKHGGIGIGLNIAQKIIKEQGGLIHAYNEGDNAVFEISLKSA